MSDFNSPCIHALCFGRPYYALDKPLGIGVYIDNTFVSEMLQDVPSQISFEARHSFYYQSMNNSSRSRRQMQPAHDAEGWSETPVTSRKSRRAPATHPPITAMQLASAACTPHGSPTLQARGRLHAATHRHAGEQERGKGWKIQAVNCDLLQASISNWAEFL